MQRFNRVIKTIAGAFCLLLGIAFIILPGPAILFIPLGLVLLSEQFPAAKRYLRHYQRHSRKAAAHADKWVSTSKQRLRALKIKA
ncbi:PGPGW domain-containing protein [Thalassotalea ponticola]|uniref:PGPGW domain-containing protein n=1 Tax=Thalassotalea ponticola TaxID=1523392 RepID=UPI0025B3199A|nr:PGPGW domain-containing protein [Thalassotalea ponticola]MDN3652007.1 PGPGW domain-containing protein [Thalassotalea ponticola]